MPTKVDRTASMLCRRAGCSSAELAQRVIAAEAEVALYRSALESIRDNSRDREAASIAQHALKGDGAK